jgi:hypothetical protein
MDHTKNPLNPARKEAYWFRFDILHAGLHVLHGLGLVVRETLEEVLDR